MTYGELPVKPKFDIHMACTRGCEGEYSCTRGDYFWARQDQIVTCKCGAAMRLVRVHITLRTVALKDAEG